ncbi:MAG: DNA mismatch repair protein MutS [Cytophagales bacterium]|nr:MAG: DNA mismatch repair protein MutS [Cytophagales bacterium]
MSKQNKENAKETPLMKQYQSFKTKYPGALLLMRVGDFYETFGEDAVVASQILGITLTKRHNGAASEIALAGFPHHALDAYLPKLVKAGQRVAICDQLEDPRFTKNIVKRGVTELVTPGVAYSEHVLESNKNNYLAAITQQKETIGIALTDISTGEFLTTQGDWAYVQKLLQSFNPSEILLSKAQKHLFPAYLQEQYHLYPLDDWFFEHSFGYDVLIKHFKVNSLKGFGIENYPIGIAAAGAILHYLNDSQYTHLQHITSIARIEEERYMWLDAFTIRNLELIYPQQENGATLLKILDKTQTPMGARLLRKWLTLPLKEKNRIEDRLQIVEIFTNNSDQIEELNVTFKHIGDLERLISKVASRRVKPRELLQIKKSLFQIEQVKEILQKIDTPALQKFIAQLQDCSFIAQKIEKTILNDAKNLISEGGIIQNNINTELDELHHLVENSKQYLEKIRQDAVQETGISSLKIDYNKVFGYYLEVTNSHKNKVPKSWIRKQTLTNAERYITEELKIYEDKIVHAEEKINILEQKIYQDLVEEVADFILPIQQNAKVIAMLDCLNNFAYIALKYQYTRPTITTENILRITQGRHPVIEQQLPAGEPYIPNDVLLDTENQQIIVITGPNMAGKSALLRQVALIVLMAQIGSFVPAEAAEMAIIDKIFTRVGASDNIAQGESTFMVEMMETAGIMNNLSENSLILMDEIGRGTSTYDGISIAWAILEYLHNHPKYRPKTLFATHYHELNELAKDFPRIKNFHVTVKEANNQILFLRKLAEGGSAHSFGIHVAQMAGMPRSVVLRANEIMQLLEADRSQTDSKTRQTLQDMPKQTIQMKIFEPQHPTWEQIKKVIHPIDINSISPVEALLKLNEIIQISQKEA